MTKMRQKFNNQSTHCTLKNLRNLPKKQTIIDALGAHAYSDSIASGEAATNIDNSTDGGDACHAGYPADMDYLPDLRWLWQPHRLLLREVLTGFLKTDPLSMDTSNPIHKIWSPLEYGATYPSHSVACY